MQPIEQPVKTTLNARLNDAPINENNPFEEDLLKRKPYAEILTNVLSIYTNGAVIALNGKWGTGKTTFVKKWQKMLEKETPKFNTVYFNAWQSDYVDDPLIPLIVNLNQCKHVDEKQEKKFAEVLNAGFKILMGTAIGLGKGLIKTVGNDILTSGIDALGNEVNNIFKKQVDESEKQSSNMEEFKKALKGYVDYLNSENPLVYFVDELDRCNPTFAVKVLERIKHLFEIENIIFILSIDKEQLENSIKGYFGSGIDAEDYLRRFIDISYNLPQPELKDYCNHLYEYYELQSFFQNKKRERNFENEGALFLNTAVYICTCDQITLRQMDRIFALTAITLKEFELDHSVFPDLFFFLVYLKICFPFLFEKINDRKLSVQELIQEIEKNISSQVLYDVYSVQGYNASDYNKTIAQLLVTYVSNELGNNESLIKTNPDRLSFSVSKLSSDQLLQNIKNLKDSFQGDICQIKHLTDKINLLDNFKN